MSNTGTTRSRQATTSEDAEQEQTLDERYGGQPPADAPGVTRNPDGSLDAPPAHVAVQRYAPAQGWEVGNAAPEDRYAAIDETGQVTGKLSKTPAKGYGRQIAAKGDVITQAVADQLAAYGG